MLGPWTLLPFLEGWDYHPYMIPATVITKGAYKLLKRIEKPGWLMSIILFTNDSYGTLRVTYQGERRMPLTGLFDPESANYFAAFQQDPSGWIQLYNRPFPPSTAGLYAMTCVSPGWHGSPLPYVPNILVEGILGAGSTQSSALLTAAAHVIEIVDEASFKRSLRKLMLPTMEARK